MLEELLAKEESKTLEFKENTEFLPKIIQTIIAFANTAGGTLVLGVKDKTKEVVGLTNALLDEEKIINAIAESISPLLVPINFFLYTWRKRDVLIVTVPHASGPYYLKSKGLDHGTFVRLGSTNRVADKNMILEIERSRNHEYFDEQPNAKCPLGRLQTNIAEQLFGNRGRNFNEKKAQSLELIVNYKGDQFPSNGGVLLLAESHTDFFPDAVIRLGRFAGIDKTRIIDQQIVSAPILLALEPIIMFIQRHTSIAAEIESIRRKDIPQYPPVVVREAIINALLHADYSVKGASITVAIFDDRIEVTNPGALPFGLNLETALAGVSLLRNRVIGRVFRELNIIEQWGSGLGRMVKLCRNHAIKQPKFEELGNFFKVTLYHSAELVISFTKLWYKPIFEYLQKNNEMTPKEAQKLWKIGARATTNRLRQMVDEGILVEIATSPFDPLKSFVLAERK